MANLSSQLRVIVHVAAATAVAARGLSSPWLGANQAAASLIHPPWQNSSFLSALPSLSLNSLRFPAGKWRKGRGDEPQLASLPRLQRLVHAHALPCHPHVLSCTRSHVRHVWELL